MNIHHVNDIGFGGGGGGGGGVGTAYKQHCLQRLDSGQVVKCSDVANWMMN